MPERTPVLVGVGAILQREEDPAKAREPLDLMAAALEHAAEDAGAPDLLRRADSIRMSRGFWDYANPGRALAERFGNTRAKTLVAEVGVLQTTLFGGAAADIAAGRCDVVLIAGGEAKYRSSRAQKSGVEAPLSAQRGEPNRVLRPHGDIMSELEARLGLVMPVNQYALIENALRYAEGQSLAEHRQEVAAMWAGMSQVAEGNPMAWAPHAVPTEEIRDPGPRNPMLAFPYTRRHNSQWNVDQAAGLILCSLATARSLGVPEGRLVFPLAAADANHMLALSERRELHRSPGFRHAGRHCLDRAGLAIGDVAHRELYSCFPVAVRVQARELGITDDRPVTVTGGMAFAGGPLNNFVLQAAVRMAQVLREDPGSVGMVNAVSGIMTKQGVTLWSTAVPETPFAFADVTEATARDVAEIPVRENGEGEATVASYTVQYQGDAPQRTILLCDLAGDDRALLVNEDPELALLATQQELCGRRVRLGPDSRVDLLD